MSDLASAQKTRTFPTSMVIAEEGSSKGGWFVLLSGRVGVFKQEAKIAEFNTRGMIFGEISSILNRPRTASLVAIEETVVMQFDTDLDDVVAHHPKVAKALIVSLSQRLEKTTEALSVAQQFFTSAG